MHFEEWMGSVSSKRSKSPGSASWPSARSLPSTARPGPWHAASAVSPTNVLDRTSGERSSSGWKVRIIADIVQTITIDATIESALTLALIVLVRTFLSFSLEIELEGVVPWHRRRRDNDRSERAVADSHDGADTATA